MQNESAILLRLQINSTGCFRLIPARCLAALADSYKLHTGLLNRETRGQSAGWQTNRTHGGVLNVEDCLAGGTDQVMVRRHVRFEAQRAVMERDLLENAGIQERFHVLVNGTQGNGWNALSDLLVDQLRSRVLMRIGHGFVDHLTLESEGKPLLLTASTKVVECLRTRIRH